MFGIEVFWAFFLPVLLEWPFPRRCWGCCSPWSTAAESWILLSPAILILGTLLQCNPAASLPLLKLPSLRRGTPLLSQGLSAASASLCPATHHRALFPGSRSGSGLASSSLLCKWVKEVRRLSEALGACPQVWDVARLQFSFPSAACFSLDVPGVFHLYIFASSEVFWKEMLHHYQWELLSSLVSWFHCPS